MVLALKFRNMVHSELTEPIPLPTRDSHGSRITQTSHSGRQDRIQMQTSLREQNRPNLPNFVSCSTTLRAVWGFFVFCFFNLLQNLQNLVKKNTWNFIFLSFLDCRDKGVASFFCLWDIHFSQIKRLSTSSLNCFGTFVENQLTINVSISPLTKCKSEYPLMIT